MAEKSVISPGLRRRLFIVKIDVPGCALKILRNYSTNTPRLKRVFHVTRLYATAGISRYRLINVAPICTAIDRMHQGGILHQGADEAYVILVPEATKVSQNRLFAFFMK